MNHTEYVIGELLHMRHILMTKKGRFPLKENISCHLKQPQNVLFDLQTIRHIAEP